MEKINGLKKQFLTLNCKFNLMKLLKKNEQLR